MRWSPHPERRTPARPATAERKRDFVARLRRECSSSRAVEHPDRRLVPRLLPTARLAARTAAGPQRYALAVEWRREVDRGESRESDKVAAAETSFSAEAGEGCGPVPSSIIPP